MKYVFKAGERCKFDRTLRYVDRCEPDANGFVTATCRLQDSMTVPAESADAVAASLNEALGHIDVPRSLIARERNQLPPSQRPPNQPHSHPRQPPTATCQYTALLAMAPCIGRIVGVCRSAA